MSAAEAQPQRRYTVEEYFALEEQSDIRHEYFHGEVFPMDAFDSPEGKAGATKRHNRLIQNLIVGLRNSLRDSTCEVYSENVRLALDPQGHYNYPDVIVSCDPQDDDPRTVCSPVLIMEVLSKSTEARDRGWKFEQYQTLLSLQQYVLVSQNRILVDSFVRTGPNTWELTTLRRLTDELVVAPLGIHISVAAIYERVDIPPLRLADAGG